MELFDLQPYAGKRVCVALSGGRDSVALLHYFRQNAARFSVGLSALTCEHGLRKEASLEDLAFVECLCREWNVPLRVFRADVARLAKERKEGVEEAGRNWRYACFGQVLSDGEADLVATAHHRDDYAETVLFRLARGTSLAGLNVFPEREGIARPLLSVTRAQIDAYIRENHIPFVEDASNADQSITRNRLRHTVLPALEGAVPGAAEHLVEFARRAAADEEYLCTLARASVTAAGKEARVAADLPEPLFFRACLYAMKFCGLTRDYTSANFAEIAGLRKLQSGRRAMLPQGLLAVREGREIVFCRERPCDPGETAFRPGTFEEFPLIVEDRAREDALCADLDAFPPGCVVRTRREGDVFTPFGGGKKALKKFLTDRKIAARIGKTLPLVAKGSEVFAVCGVEIADSVKVTSGTRHLIYLYTPLRVPDHIYGGKT